MRYSVRTITAPSLIPLPFTLADAKVHLRVDAADTSEDALITSQIRAAMGYVERYTGHVLTARELELVRSGFPAGSAPIDLPREPVNSVSSVTYSNQTMGAAVIMATTDWRWSDIDPLTVKTAFGTSWPPSANETGSVRVRFNAGYAADAAPPGLVAAAKLMLGHLFENRSAVGQRLDDAPLSVLALCDQFRIPVV